MNPSDNLSHQLRQRVENYQQLRQLMERRQQLFRFITRTQNSNSNTNNDNSTHYDHGSSNLGHGNTFGNGSNFGHGSVHNNNPNTNANDGNNAAAHQQNVQQLAQLDAAIQQAVGNFRGNMPNDLALQIEAPQVAAAQDEEKKESAPVSPVVVVPDESGDEEMDGNEPQNSGIGSETVVNQVHSDECSKEKEHDLVSKTLIKGLCNVSSQAEANELFADCSRFYDSLDLIPHVESNFQSVTESLGLSSMKQGIIKIYWDHGSWKDCIDAYRNSIKDSDISMA